MRARLSHLTLILEIPKFKRHIKINRNIKSAQVFLFPIYETEIVGVRINS